MKDEKTYAPDGNDELLFDPEEFRRKFNETLQSEKSAPAPAEEKGPAPRRKKRVFLKVLCVILALVIAVSASAAGLAFYVTRDYESEEFTHNSDVSSLMQSPGVTNILLMGIDTADVNASNRSDSMILLSVDSVHSTLKLTSFMRDMYVDVPGYGYTKLTHACAWGGPQLTVDTIENNFNIRIDGYVKIGYDIFKELVDGVDGITIPEIDEVESKALAKEKVYIEPGLDIHLNGNEALQYCRIRKGQTDFARTQRQREVISLIIKKAMRTNPAKLLSLGASVISQVNSSLSRKDIAAAAIKILPCLAGEIKQQQIPADGTWWNETVSGMAVLRVHFDENIEILKEFIY